MLYKYKKGMKQMSLESVKAHFKQWNREQDVMEFDISSATVAFGLKQELDVSMKRFRTVFPACGSTNSAIELSTSELFEYSFAKEWVDVCKGWEEAAEQKAGFAQFDSK